MSAEVVAAAVAGLLAATSVLPAEPAPWGWPLAGGPNPMAVVGGFQPPAQPWEQGHRGVDLLATPGAAVLATRPGTVSFAGTVAGKPVVVVRHGGGLRTSYEPVVATVATGARVVAGQVLGMLSAAGSHCLPRACLHWGLLRGHAYLDPLALLGLHPTVRLLPVWTAGGPSAAPTRTWVPAADAPSAARAGALDKVPSTGWLEQ